MIAELGAQYVQDHIVEEGFEKPSPRRSRASRDGRCKKLPELDALTMAYNAVNQGAAGVDMGRNISSRTRRKP